MYSQDLLINWLIIVTIYSEITDLYKTKLLQNRIVFYKKQTKKYYRKCTFKLCKLTFAVKFYINIQLYLFTVYNLTHIYSYFFEQKHKFYLFYTDLNTFQKTQIVVYFTANLFCTV